MPEKEEEREEELVPERGEGEERWRENGKAEEESRLIRKPEMAH